MRAAAAARAVAWAAADGSCSQVSHYSSNSSSSSSSSSSCSRRHTEHRRLPGGREVRGYCGGCAGRNGGCGGGSALSRQEQGRRWALGECQSGHCGRQSTAGATALPWRPPSPCRAAGEVKSSKTYYGAYRGSGPCGRPWASSLGSDPKEAPPVGEYSPCCLPAYVWSWRRNPHTVGGSTFWSEQERRKRRFFPLTGPQAQARSCTLDRVDRLRARRRAPEPDSSKGRYVSMDSFS